MEADDLPSMCGFTWKHRRVQLPTPTALLATSGPSFPVPPVPGPNLWSLGEAAVLYGTTSRVSTPEGELGWVEASFHLETAAAHQLTQLAQTEKRGRS